MPCICSPDSNSLMYGLFRELCETCGLHIQLSKRAQWYVDLCWASTKRQVSHNESCGISSLSDSPEPSTPRVFLVNPVTAGVIIYLNVVVERRGKEIVRHYSNGGCRNERCWRGKFSLLRPPDDAAEQAIGSAEGYVCRSPRTSKLSNTVLKIKR